MLKAFLGDMLARDHGHIIEIASAAGHFGAVDLTDYCASKFAIAGLFECLVLEIAAAKKTDVHCTLVSPFFLNTGMFSGVSTR
jgi:all-trans-retinol dehydrogenase (NAD+)